MASISLCGKNGCHRVAGHKGTHSAFPKDAWGFFREVDQNKIDKAGYATPRGGAKGAYQNHVYRNNQVIVPFERIKDVDLKSYEDGYVIRLYPRQYFEQAGVPKDEFTDSKSLVKVGSNAFVLYRSHESLEKFPPPDDWEVRYLRKERDGQHEIVRRRGNNVEDAGEYVLRLPTLGDKKTESEGPPQGIFAPEYAAQEINYLSQCVLAWLIVHAVGSPYTSSQAAHLNEILSVQGLNDSSRLEYLGIVAHGLTKCPLCMRFIRYQELHATVSFAEEAGLSNASEQVPGTTRSTIVNLFHLTPLIYNELRHLPSNVAWGHAVCNTRLGQRRSYSLDELIEMELKVGIIRPEGIETFGWISEDLKMIRSPEGAVWVQLHGDIAEEDPPTIVDEKKQALESEEALLLEDEFFES